MADKDKNQGKVTPDADHDRIVMASRSPDGTPAQFEPEFIGDKETAEKAAATQLSEQKVSAADVAIRGVATEGSAEGSSEPDAAVAKIVDAHKSAEKKAEAQAKSEISKLHEGLGDNS